MSNETTTTVTAQTVQQPVAAERPKVKAFQFAPQNPVAAAFEKMLERGKADTTEPVKDDAVEDTAQVSTEADDAEALEGADVATDGQEPDEQQSAADSDQKPTEAVKIEIDGAEKEVALHELVDAYKKVQAGPDVAAIEAAVAERTKEVDSIKATYEAKAQDLETGIGIVAQMLQAQLTSEQELFELSKTDPASYVAKKAQNEEVLKKINGAFEAVQMVQKQKQAEFAAIRQKASDELKAHVAKAYPTLVNNASEQQAIVKFALSNGYTNEELVNLVDKRDFDMLFKAYKYEQLQAQKPEALKKVAAAPQALKPKQRPVEDGGARAVNKATQLFKQKPDLKNAALLLATRSGIKK